MSRPSHEPAGIAWQSILVPALCAAVVLFALSGRYGYHRDELYFLACGRHLAWGYPDQPPLVPLIARAMSGIAPHSVVVLRLPSVLVVAGVAVLSALTTRELGGDAAAQALSAWGTTVAAFVLGAGHLLSTSTVNLLAWSVLLYLIVRVLRTGHQRLWVVVGVVAGVGLLANDLVAFLIGAVVLGLALVGPRAPLRSVWLHAGGGLALLLWLPYLIWQSRHGWPELTIAHNIARGGSGSSTSRWAILPEQLGLAGPWIAPIWIAGLAWMWRNPIARSWRCLAVAWLVLLLAFELTGGKGYYLGMMLPFLLAAGSQPTVEWMRRSSSVRRKRMLVASIALSAPSMAFALPVLPLGALHGSLVLKANYDLGETIGWPRMTKQIAAVYDHVADPAGVALLASNYGEAGAIDQYGPALGLPHAYGVQNAYWLWGPPPATATTLITIGFTDTDLAPVCSSSQLAVHLDPGHDVDNDENGKPVYVCDRNQTPWRSAWVQLRRYG